MEKEQKLSKEDKKLIVFQLENPQFAVSNCCICNKWVVGRWMKFRKSQNKKKIYCPKCLSQKLKELKFL